MYLTYVGIETKRGKNRTTLCYLVLTKTTTTTTTIMRSALYSATTTKTTAVRTTVGAATAMLALTRRVSGLASRSAAAAAVEGVAIAGARRLGHERCELVVSEACLGTMTWGVQNDREDAFAQLRHAVDEAGVNFVDTAELYPVPLTAPDWRAGATEEILGEWLASIGPARRDELVIATKVCGYFPDSAVAANRKTPPLTERPFPTCRLDAASVREATDASLRRLRTDRIDLMQIHWPDRYVPVFGQTTFRHENKRDDSVPIEETASALRDLIDEGKIRYVGLSNESTLGVCEWVAAAEKYGIRDRLVSIQNSYNLLDRRFDGELAEACDRHGLGLLPWSVLAGGLLSGKYRAGVTPNPCDRFTKYPEYMSRWSPKTAAAPTIAAADAYAEIAKEAGTTPAKLAIDFCRSRRFVSDAGSVIVGATTVDQLRENLEPFSSGDASTPPLSEDVLASIDEVHLRCPNPSCSL